MEDKGVSWDGPYVTVAYEADTGRGSEIKEVRISSRGVTVNGRPLVRVGALEDGEVDLYYTIGDEVHKVPIRLSDVTVKFVSVDGLTTAFDNDDISKIGIDFLEELGIEDSKSFTERVAYAAYGPNKDAFNAEYGDGKCDAFLDAADEFIKLTTGEALEKMGLDIDEIELKSGVRPERGTDILATTKSGEVIQVEVKFVGAGEDNFNQGVYNLKRQGKTDIGIVFWEGEYYVFVNLATKYEPLANIAKGITREGSRSLKDLAGIAIMGGLSLLSGYFASAKGGVRERD